MELNSKSLEMQKWNILTDRAQRVYEKNGVIRLVIMFASRLIKMSELDDFFVFSYDDSKKSATVWAKYLSVSER